MGTKTDPGRFDCYAAAEPNEPLFILLARDKHAEFLVVTWASLRAAEIARGERDPGERDQVDEALDCARSMIKWRKANRP